MPTTRRTSGGRHRAPATPVLRRARDLPAAALKVGLAVALAVSLGGYTVAESTTQRASVAGLQLQAQEEAQARRDAVVAERQRAVATAETAIAGAQAVQTVAATAVSQAELAPLTQAVDELNALLGEVPAAPAPLDATDAAATDDPAATEAAPQATAVDRTARASRAAGRSAVPGDPAATPEPAADATVAERAEQVEEDATEDAAGPAATPTDQPADGGLADATDDPAPADDAAPQDDFAAKILAAVARVTEVAAQVQAAADAQIAAQQAAAAAAAAEKEAQRVSLDAYANGRIPDEALCDLGVDGGHLLRCDAADAFAALNAAYAAEFGQGLSISDSYRSYAAQVACVRVKGGLCARPGTSNHGLGLAIDLAGGVQTFGTAQHRWMASNAGQYGWDLPDWASAGGSKPEPWHWEYVG